MGRKICPNLFLQQPGIQSMCFMQSQCSDSYGTPDIGSLREYNFPSLFSLTDQRGKKQYIEERKELKEAQEGQRSQNEMQIQIKLH